MTIQMRFIPHQVVQGRPLRAFPIKHPVVRFNGISHTPGIVARFCGNQGADGAYVLIQDNGYISTENVNHDIFYSVEDFESGKHRTKPLVKVGSVNPGDVFAYPGMGIGVRFYHPGGCCATPGFTFPLWGDFGCPQMLDLQVQVEVVGRVVFLNEP